MKMILRQVEYLYVCLRMPPVYIYFIIDVRHKTDPIRLHLIWDRFAVKTVFIDRNITNFVDIFSPHHSKILNMLTTLSFVV